MTRDKSSEMDHILLERDKRKKKEKEEGKKEVNGEGINIGKILTVYWR